jgi:ppGpp synthetase/RelA/SpoT-type nucleotidyltranferase
MTTMQSPHTVELLDAYHAELPQLEKLAEQASDLLQAALREQNIQLNAFQRRVKTEESLTGKLEKKGYKYQTIYDITDLVGIRVVTYYTDDVDKVAVIAKQIFDIDWKNSVDKRKHQLDSFGYLSLHYICYMKEGPLRNIPFEIQMRTALQHVWSAIEHDIGYKGAVKLPPEFVRQFSRLAGMLEMADDEFSRLRTTMTEYRRQVQSLVKSGHFSEVSLSTDSFRQFLDLHPFDRLNQRIAAVNQAEIYPAPMMQMMQYLTVFESFRFKNLGDVQKFIEENSEGAYQLALSQLAITDLDILSESIGLQNLCLVHVIKQGGGLYGIKAVYDAVNGEQASNTALAENILRLAQQLPFMHKL